MAVVLYRMGLRPGHDSGAKLKPRGASILSCTTLLATSPPRSSATAPTMAYREVMRTVSKPEP
ncbi:hypothetical protein IG631_03868 [Alternaria alternata]|nr:hypothetical protein IG631_03868 [Alternaria alternata]